MKLSELRMAIYKSNFTSEEYNGLIDIIQETQAPLRQTFISNLCQNHLPNAMHKIKKDNANPVGIVGIRKLELLSILHMGNVSKHY